MIARDRSTEYARGITEGAPKAAEVADRWHLLHNFRQVLERFFHEAKVRLESLPALEETVLTAPRPPQRRTTREIAASEAARQARLERYMETRRLRGEESLNISQISRALGMSRVTVRKYLSAEVFPEWTRHPTRQSILAPYKAYLEERWAEGGRSALGLFRELQERGYTGSSRPVTRWVQERRTEPHPCTPTKYRATCLAKPEPGRKQAKLPAPRRLSWLLTGDPDMLNPMEARLLGTLRTDPAVERAYGLARSYVTMIRERRVEEFDAWLSRCSASAITGFETFATGLRQDYRAVRAALVEPWSNGQAEGQINRLKTIKRQMYGRAGFELLRKRVLYAP
jgi:transposase